jgi:PleD family two-component response regulator
VALEVSIGTAAILKGDGVEDILRRAERNVFRAKSGD